MRRDSAEVARVTRPGASKGAVLAIVAAAQFVIVLDVAIVNVALPSIQRDLTVAQNLLQWVAVAYGLTFGGLLLLGGRAADLFGRRRVLLSGLVVFGVSSLVAGLSDGIGTLILARGAQGIGAALVAPAALSILTTTFAEGAERNRALAVFGAVGGTAASAGVALGGVITSGPGWEWIFFVNVPVAGALLAAALTVLPESRIADRGGIDVAGAITGTAGLLVLVYGLNKSVDWGWDSSSTLALLATAGVLLATFLVLQSRLHTPMVPLSIFRNRSLAAANGVGALLFGAFFPTIFISTLYMQQVLGFSSLRAGLFYLTLSGSFLISAAITGEKVVTRTGPKLPLVTGQVMTAGGLVWLSRATPDGAFMTDLLPGFLLVGLGMGLAVVSAQVAAFAGVRESQSGLASGLINTAQEIGGALGIAITSTVALSRTKQLFEAGTAAPIALTEGFGDGYLAAAGLAAAAAIIAMFAFARRPVDAAPAATTEPALEPQKPVRDARKPAARRTRPSRGAA